MYGIQLPYFIASTGHFCVDNMDAAVVLQSLFYKTMAGMFYI